MVICGSEISYMSMWLWRERENGGMCIETKTEEGWERGNWKGGATLADGTLGIRLSLKSVSAVFLMCTRL